MKTLQKFKFPLVIFTFLLLYGCMVTRHADTYQNILNKNLQGETLGKAKFLHGDMGGLEASVLKSNGFVYKIAVIALQTHRPEGTIPALFTPYGFVFSKKIWNWENAPAPELNKPIGLVFGKLTGTHPTKGKYLIETADFSCAACHGAPLYGKDGNLTEEYVLGMPNTSLNLDAFAHDLFSGYTRIIRWNTEKFSAEILKIFPNTPKEEMTGLSIMFQALQKEIPKIQRTRKEPAAYKIGATGLLNGIGAIKARMNLIDGKTYHSQESALTAIPALVNRSFRSSFLVSGNYAPMGQPFFKEITKKDTTLAHNMALANIASLFTIGTMGFSAEMAAKTTSDMQDVMRFIAKMQSPRFPAAIDSAKAVSGKAIFQAKCQSCHGKYEGIATQNVLISFPNHFVSMEKIGTDSLQAVAITEKDFNTLEKTPLKGRFQAKANRGYVAPILTGVWATAPYFHNGSVPTLWHLMHPEARPNKFYVGGHALDYEKMGIKGTLKNGIYQYDTDYKAWSNPEIYNTNQYGFSNKGHTKPFDTLTETEKDHLLEFLKTL